MNIRNKAIILWAISAILVFGLWGGRMNFWSWMAWMIYTAIVWTEIWEVLFGPCKYSRICPYYRKEQPACNDYNANGGYCGKFREYEKRKEK